MEPIIPDYSKPISYVVHSDFPTGARGSAYLNHQKLPMREMSCGQLKALVRLLEVTKAGAEYALEVKLEVNQMTED